jgi:eukaryotic translation initiation factor 2C
MAPFYEFGNLADVLRNHLVKRSRFPAFVNGLNIKTTHLGHRKTIRRMSRYTAKTYVFNYAEFGDVSVEEYIFRSMFIRAII